MLDILSGVTVLDLTSNVAGPYCTLILADLGATVWKIEPKGLGDVVRSWPPFAPDGVSTTFLALNRGKKSVTLDLRSERGRSALLQLASHSDVLVSSLRPGSLERLGLGLAQFTDVNPRMITADISAFGGRGARGNQPGFDAVLQAYTGIMDLTGHPGEPPARVGTGIVDFGTGLWAALGVVAALLKRDRTGIVDPVSATLFGTAIGFIMHHLASVEFAGATPSRIGTAQHNSAPYEAIATADGMVMVGVTSAALWTRFCEAIGAAELIDRLEFASNDLRVANRAALRAEIEERTVLIPSIALVDRFEAAGVPCSQIRDVSTLVSDPQLAASGLWQPTDHGGSAAAIPLTMGDRFAEIGPTAPAAGADTVSVLTEAGMASEDIEALVGALAAARADTGAAAAQPNESEKNT